MFVFNFHPTNSYTDYRVGCLLPGPYKVRLDTVFASLQASRSDRYVMCVQLVLSSDEAVFGGYENVSKKYDAEYFTKEGDFDRRPHSFQVQIHFFFALVCFQILRYFLSILFLVRCIPQAAPWLSMHQLSLQTQKLTRMKPLESLGWV